MGMKKLMMKLIMNVQKIVMVCIVPKKSGVQVGKLKRITLGKKKG